MNTKSIYALLALISCSACSMYGMDTTVRKNALATFATEVVKTKYAKRAQANAAQPSWLGNWRSYVSHIQSKDLKQSVQTGLSNALANSKRAVSASRNWVADAIEQHPSILAVPFEIALAYSVYHLDAWHKSTVPAAN